jgi:hypothetical protein
MDNRTSSHLDFRRLEDSEAVSQFYEALSDASIYQYPMLAGLTRRCLLRNTKDFRLQTGELVVDE